MAEYRKLANYSNYRIYPDGRIYSEFVNRFITATKDSGGYLQNTLVDDNGNRNTLKNHILVASAFIPRVINKIEVNHKDFNKENNTVENLEWCDRKYNMKYNSTHRENKRAKELSPLTEEQVLLIPEMMNNGFSIKFIAKLLNVGHVTIRKIITHKTWKYLNLVIPTRYFIRNATIEVSRKLYDKLIAANVDNTVLNSRIKILESV